MKPYPEYKETGLSWLPKIPRHWEVVRAKQLFKIIDIRSESGDEELLSVSERYGVVKREDAKVTMFMANSYEGYKLCWPNDLVVNSLWAWSYGLGFSQYHGIISTAYSVYRLKDKTRALPRYFDYFVRGKDFHWELRIRSKGLWKSRYQLSDDSFLSAPVILPPMEEQKRIVRYLDLMTAKIDKLIDAKKKQIALKIERLNSYLFSEKGATHLGWWETCFPSHWNLEKARRIFVERNQKGYSDRELLAVTQDQGILYKKDCPQHFVEPGDTKTQKLVCTGDCVISLRSFQGGVETSDFEGLVSAAYSVFYMKKTDLLLSNYYRYLFKTPAFIAYLNTLVRDIRDGKKIGFDDFRECFLPIPPAAHLEKIKGFVDEIEILKKSLYNEQKLLREYKDSLISSIVTGGLEVSLYKNWRSSLR